MELHSDTQGAPSARCRAAGRQRHTSLRGGVVVALSACVALASAVAPAGAGAAGARTHARGTAASRFAGATAGTQTDFVKSGAVSVKVSCPSGTDKHCVVKLTLRAKNVKVGSKKETLTLGRGSASIEPSRSASVRVKLSTEAEKVLKGAKGRLSAEAILTSTDGRGAKATKTGRVTVRAKKPVAMSPLY
ncbi:MAG: hypothetical protein ACRDK7_10995 [Solirubrobacteraceae bacterium]